MSLAVNDTYNKKVVTRFPPSPTGNLHVGGARTALFNWLFARKHGGEIIFRLEDTDKDRSKKEYEDNIKEGLKWLGFSFDEEYKQSERTETYDRYLDQLLKEDKAYFSREPSKDDPTKEIEVVRLRNRATTMVFDDTIRGRVEMRVDDLGDFVIAKGRGEPLYHLAVVVDDYEMGVTDVIRGEDHISNTPRQILIQEAIGATRPIYAHIPLLFAPDRSKLSKRHGAVAVTEYRDMGYLPEAFLNYFALLGWSPGDDQEVFTLEELIEKFDLSRVQKGGAVFDIKKLNWMNKEHIKRLPEEKFFEEILKWMPEGLKKLQGFDKNIVRRMLPELRERIEKFGDLQSMAESGDFQYFFEDPQYEIEKLSWKNVSPEATNRHLQELINILEKADDVESYTKIINEDVLEYSVRAGKGNVLWPLRYALSGREKSPSPFVLAVILGKEMTLRRLRAACEKLETCLNQN